MLSAEKLLSATDVQRVLGLSREGLRKLRKRGDGPKSMRVGSVNVTPLRSFLDWVSRELARACRPKWMRRLAR
jgi:predicted DNA-binding transcriptional regulator AlpA